VKAESVVQSAKTQKRTLKVTASLAESGRSFMLGFGCYRKAVKELSAERREAILVHAPYRRQLTTGLTCGARYIRST